MWWENKEVLLGLIWTVSLTGELRYFDRVLSLSSSVTFWERTWVLPSLWSPTKDFLPLYILWIRPWKQFLGRRNKQLYLRIRLNADDIISKNMSFSREKDWYYSEFDNFGGQRDSFYSIQTECLSGIDVPRNRRSKLPESPCTDREACEYHGNDYRNVEPRNVERPWPPCWAPYSREEYIGPCMHRVAWRPPWQGHHLRLSTFQGSSGVDQSVTGVTDMKRKLFFFKLVGVIKDVWSLQPSPVLVVKTLKAYSWHGSAWMVKILDPLTGVIFKFGGAKVCEF